jgi:hypothetical protein
MKFGTHRFARVPSALWMEESGIAAVKPMQQRINYVVPALSTSQRFLAS